ncbi:pyridoxamine 5'-phosphate oxidase family protein [Specibacter sp. RAF43]|uniref:pyridoxamine 5'-phosphate oxidase family protein n=1 Tax=Specibacter sp. RAF43 TaxID=3233057 RepID=UPI003F9948BA
MTTPPAPAGASDLSRDECWHLLQGQVIGRLAVVVEDHPEIFPVNYAVDNGSLLFRTAEGTKLYGSLNNTPVAFEVDGYDPHTEQAWSVVLRGRAEQLKPATGLADARALPLEPWQPGRKEHLVRIYALSLSGRRFRVTRPDLWSTPLGDARRASFE